MAQVTNSLISTPSSQHSSAKSSSGLFSRFFYKDAHEGSLACKATKESENPAVASSVKRVLPRKVKTTLDLSYKQGACDISLIAKHTINLEEIDLRMSMIPPNELEAAIPFLKKNNPDLKKLNLEFAYIDNANFKRLLEAFPRLEEIRLGNIQLLDVNQASRDIIEWLKNNPCIKSIKKLFISSQEEFKALTCNISNTIEVIDIVFTGTSSDVPIMYENFPAFAAKCQSLRHLTLNSLEGKKTISKANVLAIPSQLPHLEHLYVDTALPLESKEVLTVLLHLKKTTCIRVSDGSLSGADTVTLINTYAHQLKRLNLMDATQYTTEDLQNISAALSKCPHLVSVIYPLYAAIDFVDNDPAFTNLQPVLPQLERFDINWCNVSSVNMEYLGTHLGNANMKRIDVLNICYATGQSAKMSPESLARALSAILSRSPNIQVLSFGNVSASPSSHCDDLFKEALKNTGSLNFISLQISLYDFTKGLSFLNELTQRNPNLRSIECNLGGQVDIFFTLHPKMKKSVTITNVSASS